VSMEPKKKVALASVLAGAGLLTVAGIAAASTGREGAKAPAGGRGVAPPPPPPPPPPDPRGEVTLGPGTMTRHVEPEPEEPPMVRAEPEVAPAEQCATAKPVVESPIPGVSDAQWKAYLRALSDPNHQKKVSARNSLGAFFFTYPRLEDLGLVRNVRKVDKNGKQVYTGDFVPPLTLAKFLAEAPLQVKAMELSAKDYLPKVKNVLGGYVGTQVEGQAVTLSGILAVAHRAGFKGAQSWFKDPRDRTKFPNTTAAYKAANGAF